MRAPVNLQAVLLALGMLLPAYALAQASHLPRDATTQASHSGSWTLGVGGSVATRYTYKTSRSMSVEEATQDDILGNTWLASLSLNQGLDSSLSLQGGLDYFQQQHRGWLETAHIGCLSAGIRWSTTRHEAARPYVEVSPALFIGTWSDDLHHDSITSIRPGVVVGTGIVMGPASSRMRLDLGVKGHLSADWAGLTNPDRYSEYHGVKRMSFGAKLLVML